MSIIPEIHEHFTHHNESNKKLSFFDFIVLHITPNSHSHEKDSHHHSHAPKQLHAHVSAFVLNPQFKLHIAQITSFTNSENKVIIPYNEPNSEYDGSIWQPPQIG